MVAEQQSLLVFGRVELQSTPLRASTLIKSRFTKLSSFSLSPLTRSFILDTSPCTTRHAAAPSPPSTTRSGCVASRNELVPGKSECAEKLIVTTLHFTSIVSVCFPLSGISRSLSCRRRAIVR